MLTALIVIVVLAILTQLALSRLALLFATGTALGIVLYQSLFGFTGAFRALLADGRSAGFRAQMIMLSVTCILFFPALGAGSILGQPVVGFVSPVGILVAVGSFFSGIASGSLHGLLWIVFALIGNRAALCLRP